MPRPTIPKENECLLSIISYAATLSPSKGIKKKKARQSYCIWDWVAWYSGGRLDENIIWFANEYYFIFQNIKTKMGTQCLSPQLGRTLQKSRDKLARVQNWFEMCKRFCTKNNACHKKWGRFTKGEDRI